MDILLIGNGFDLAHGLPTKYTDFLEFVKMIKIIKEQNIFNDGDAISKAGCNKDNKKLHKDIRLIILGKANSKKLARDSKKLLECIDNNLWIEYFIQCPMYQKENWIDFESEISRVIQLIDNDMKQNGFDENNIIRKLANEEITKMEKAEGEKWSVAKTSEYVHEYLENHPIENLKEKITYKQLIERLEEDLDRLIRALEIYLAEYVNVINDTEECKAIQSINPNCVLSFNYSNTYERLYGNTKKIEYNYIHGKADINSTIESNNMVLGIDEYLEPKRINKEISFIAFKKYYQRIYKGTGCEYRDWIYKIKESGKSIELKLQNEYPVQIPFIKFTNDARHNLYIFGHSLDVTDKDILKEIILNDNVHTTIFYMDKNDLKRKIANLVKVITQDELIRRTGGHTKTIEFKLQQGIVER